MPTIKEVAQRAGVSVTTVSRVLNRRGYISEEMYEKVGKAMEELHYRPNELARSLLRQRSHLIGVLVPQINNPFFSDVVGELIRAATVRGYKIILYCSHSDTANSAYDYVKMLQANQVDGIILGLHTRDIDKQLDASLPVVSFERYRLNQLPTVSCDNYAGGELAARELLACGCRHPVMVGTWSDIYMPAHDRYSAFCHTMEEAEHEYQTLESGEVNPLGADYPQLVRTLFERFPETDGVFCTSDHLASYVLQYCAASGRLVPEDVKVIGFNGNAFASMLTPPLTSIRQPLAAMCDTAIDLLIRQMEGEHVPSQTVMPVVLILRESTRTLPKEH